MARLFGSQRGGRRENSPAALHYYCQAKKIGQLLSAGSLCAHLDFAVKSQWVQKLFTSYKLAAAEASRAFLSCFSGAKMNLANLDLVRQRDQEERDEAERRRILQDVAVQQRAFKPQPAIEPWLQQYKVLPKERYMFLVLVGPSRTGKTCLARQLICLPHETLELNCATGAEPDLRSFTRSAHKAILFDEAPPKMVLAQKKLFQAQPAWMQLAATTTSCHANKVMLGRVPLIIASNTWVELCEELSPADREWIMANQVLVPIEEKVFFEDEVASTVPPAEEVVAPASQ